MELKEILAVSGQPGLFKYIAQSTKGIIVESLSDSRRTNIPASSKVSAMSEIAIYTDSEEVPLAKIFETIYKNTDGKETISHKSSSDELKNLFAEILPEYDRERVHVSDMKKIVAWYNILVAAGMKEFKIEEPEENEDNKSE